MFNYEHHKRGLQRLSRSLVDHH